MALFEDSDVAINALIGPSAVIQGHTFLRCKLRGPAVLLFVSDVKFTSNNIGGEVDDVVWEVNEDRRIFNGAIGVVDCRFLGCEFFNVGLAGPPQFIRLLRANTRQGQPEPLVLPEDLAQRSETSHSQGQG